MVLVSPNEVRDWLLDGLEEMECNSPGFTFPDYKGSNGPTIIIRLVNGQTFVVRVSEEGL